MPCNPFAGGEALFGGCWSVAPGNDVTYGGEGRDLLEAAAPATVSGVGTTTWPRDVERVRR